MHYYSRNEKRNSNREQDPGLLQVTRCCVFLDFIITFLIILFFFFWKYLCTYRRTDSLFLSVFLGKQYAVSPVGQEPGLKGNSLGVHSKLHVFAMGCSVVARMRVCRGVQSLQELQILCRNELVQSLILKILRGKWGMSDRWAVK